MLSAVLCVMLLLLLYLNRCNSLFFPPLGGRDGCNCGCPSPQPCPPVPSCAVSLPCPVEKVYIPSYTQTQNYEIPIQSYQTSMISCLPAGPSYAQPSQYVYPIQQVQTATAPNNYEEYSVININQYPGPTSLDPNFKYPMTPTYTDRYSYTDDSATQTSVYDDTAPALPPPVPDDNAIPPSGAFEYKTTAESQQTGDYNSKSPDEASSSYVQYDGSRSDATEGFQQFLHSGESETLPYRPQTRRISTEGIMPFDMYDKRFMVLKRMRNARHMSVAIPRTNTTCNSHKLANVMIRVMVDDVSISKKAVLKSTELAFGGDKFDVFCATGEFSYSIHSRKYCEVTKQAVTCFAFR